MTGVRVPAGRSRRAASPPRLRLGAWRRGVYEHVVFVGLILIFGAVSLLWSTLAAVLHRLLPRAIGEPLGQFAIMAVSRCFIGGMRRSGIIECDLGQLDALVDASPLVIAPNHPTLLDALLVMSRLPRVVCAAKAPIWNNPFLGGAARLAGFIRNDPPARLLREAINRSRSGRHFLIFPEGTRSAAWPVGEFKGGFALIAKRAGVPVQPVFIETNSRFLGKTWPLFKKPEFPLVYRARLGRRIVVKGDVHEAVRRLYSYYRRELGAGEP